MDCQTVEVEATMMAEAEVEVEANNRLGAI
jgi:hypothetical protein